MAMLQNSKLRLRVREVGKAFTLIELLVVIAIIAILAANAFPDTQIHQVVSPGFKSLFGCWVFVDGGSESLEKIGVAGFPNGA